MGLIEVIISSTKILIGDEENHDTKGSYVRQYGVDDILIVFYKLQPNYVCDRIFDPEDIDEDNPLGKWKRENLLNYCQVIAFTLTFHQVKKIISQYLFSLVSLLEVVHNTV